MKQLALTALVLLLAACAAPATAPQISPHCNADGPTYRMRHGGVLQFRGKTLPITGFMVLDTANGHAKVALLTGLGIKLATLEVTRDSYHALGSSPIAKAIPHFMDECAFSIRQMFLTGFPNQPEPQHDWTVSYEKAKKIGTASLPEKIMFTNDNKNYAVILQLNHAEIQ